MNWIIGLLAFICYFHYCSGNFTLDDYGFEILTFMEKFNWMFVATGRPINYKTDRICNCSSINCDSEMTKILGNNFTGMCRSDANTCLKRILVDGTILHSCVNKDAHPELFCNSKQPLADGSVMACCSNYSFCNGFMELASPPLISNNWITLRMLMIMCFVIVILLMSVMIFMTILYIHKPLKIWLFRLPCRSVCHARTQETLLNSSTEGVALLNDILGNLGYNDTTGSGSGLPLLVQRTIARQIELRTEIGKGRYGEVWLASWKGEPVAVKIFSSRDERSWVREVEVFQTNMLRHSNVLRFIASDSKDTGTTMQLWLVMEYHPGGSLYDYLSMNTVNECIMLKMIRSIANGLAFLHAEVPGAYCKPAIAHRDLKSKNILMKEDLSCVIADLGLAVRYVNGEINLPDNNKCGTVRYLSPEVLSDSCRFTQFDEYKMSDMYAVGLIIWEITRRVQGCEEPYELPYFDCVPRDPTIEDMRECVCVQKRRPAESKFWSQPRFTKEVHRIMCECWAESPSNRLTAMNVRIAVDRIANALHWNIHSIS